MDHETAQLLRERHGWDTPKGTPYPVPRLCTQPLTHRLEDGVYVHKADGSYCPLLNDPEFGGA